MTEAKCKKCRRIGRKIFLKEEKCLSTKCPLTRKPYPAGRRFRRTRALSEYGIQFKEKQKLKLLYGINEKQFVNYVKEAIKRGGTKIPSRLIQLLESRLDNTVFKLGFAKSRSGARQLVSHAHICVNGRKVNIPSFKTKKGDKITIRPQSLSGGNFADLDIWLKKYNPPSWLRLNKAKKEGEVIGEADSEKIEVDVNLNLIIEFYSR